MASRFWVGGTGTWDASNTTNWAATSGGAGGQSVPSSVDSVTIDASSGAGTITVNTNFNITGLTTGAMGMTLDFGTNNNSPTFNTNGWNNSGTGTRTINLGSGTFTFSGTNAGGFFDQGTATNLTLGANTSTFAFSGNTTNARTINLGGANLSNLPTITIGANTSKGVVSVFGAGTMTIPSLTVSGFNYIVWAPTGTVTLTNLVFSGTSASSPVVFVSNSSSVSRTIPLTNSTSGSWLIFQGITPTTGTITGTDSFNLGTNGANVSFTAPSGGGSGGGGQRVISG